MEDEYLEFSSEDQYVFIVNGVEEQRINIEQLTDKISIYDKIKKDIVAYIIPIREEINE